MARKPKSPADSPAVKNGELVPQPHGGAIRRGAKKGNTPGTGRPPSEIRARLRGSFDERIKILEEIAESPESSASDRIRALDVLAKYGLGTQQEHSGPDGTPLRFTVVEDYSGAGDGDPE
jgi:hypothetical protein